MSLAHPEIFKYISSFKALEGPWLENQKNFF